MAPWQSDVIVLGSPISSESVMAISAARDIAVISAWKAEVALTRRLLAVFIWPFGRITWIPKPTEPSACLEPSTYTAVRVLLVYWM